VGKLLIIDSVGNVVRSDVETGARQSLDEPRDPGQGSRVSSAVWSAKGEWAAWSVDSIDLDGVRELRLHHQGRDGANVLAESVSAFYLCPSPCGRWLSHLSPGPLGLELAVSDVAAGAVTVVERGQPMFWSWSPDTTRLAVHVENRVLIAGLDGEQAVVLTEDAGRFVAPWWLPGGSVAYAVGDQILSSGPDGGVNVVVGAGSSGRFSPDPDGSRLAYVEVVDGGGRLVVVDLISGDQAVVATEPVAAFFWSPNGSMLAALVAGNEGRVQWIVHDGSQVEALVPFRPTRPWAATVLPFFEQYAQSHAVWSADGTELVAPAVDDDGGSGALVQAVQAPYATRWIPDAHLAWWT